MRAPPTGGARTVDPGPSLAQVRQWVVCPACRGELEDAPRDDPEAPAAWICPACRLAYPIVDGVPWLTPDLARRIDGA